MKEFLIDEKDTYRTAKLMIDQYGVDATIEAAMRFDAMLKNGDLEGMAVWKRIMSAIDDLQAEHGRVRH